MNETQQPTDFLAAQHHGQLLAPSRADQVQNWPDAAQCRLVEKLDAVPVNLQGTTHAVELCRRFGGEIINADSRQVYKDMDIGTAKPTTVERSQAPHHLLDLLEPSENFGLGAFLPLAQQASTDIAARGLIPILAGGTGQYVWAMLEGQSVPAVPPDPEFRAALEQEAAQEGGAQALHDRLRQVDPARADALDARNVRRVIRALEIYHATNQKPSEMANPDPRPVRHLVLGLTMEREALYQRIDARVDAMMEAGFLAETILLLKSGVIVQSGTLEELVRTPADEFVTEFINAQRSPLETIA